MPVFVASDGTKFEDRNAWRRYEFETNYTFRNKTKESLVKVPGKIGGQPFDLSDLDQCEVQLLDQCDQVQVDNVTNSRVFIGPCSESVFVRNCANTVFTVACKQLRTRDCTNCTFYLYSLTDPIIETSSEMKFAPFNGAYNGIELHFKDARLEPANNHWSQVYDFNDPDKSGKNWRLLAPVEEAPAWVISLDGLVSDPASLGQCVNPVPRDAGFILYEESSTSSKNGGAMQSFTFSTTQDQAQKVLETQAVACEAEPPALAIVPPTAAIPAPPQVQDFGGAPPLPPPAPVQQSENQKVATVEAAEPLAPPPCPGTSCSKISEPAIDGVVDQVAQKLEDVIALS